MNNNDKYIGPITATFIPSHYVICFLVKHIYIYILVEWHDDGSSNRLTKWLHNDRSLKNCSTFWWICCTSSSRHAGESWPSCCTLISRNCNTSGSKDCSLVMRFLKRFRWACEGWLFLRSKRPSVTLARGENRDWLKVVRTSRGWASATASASGNDWEMSILSNDGDCASISRLLDLCWTHKYKEWLAFSHCDQY